MPLLPNIVVTLFSWTVVSTANGQFFNCATTASSERYNEHPTVTEISITIACKSCNTMLLSDKTFPSSKKHATLYKHTFLQLLHSSSGEQHLPKRRGNIVWSCLLQTMEKSLRLLVIWYKSLQCQEILWFYCKSVGITTILQKAQ